MTRDEKVVRSAASIPIWVSIRYGIDVIRDDPDQSITSVVCDRLVDVLNNVCNTYG